MRTRRLTPSGLSQRQPFAYSDTPEVLESAYTGIAEPKKNDATEKDASSQPLYVQSQVKNRIQKKR